ncbi:MAG: hypothetical protein ABSG21_18265, partial [Spirochaetia bacterium]
MPKTNKAASKKRSKQTSARLPEKAGAKKVSGTVLKIVNGKPTDDKLSAEKAFSDLEQARAQVLYVEKYGSREEKRLVRLAFRQYQG